MRAKGPAANERGLGSIGVVLGLTIWGGASVACGVDERSPNVGAEINASGSASERDPGAEVTLDIDSGPATPIPEDPNLGVAAVGPAVVPGSSAPDATSGAVGPDTASDGGAGPATPLPPSSATRPSSPAEACPRPIACNAGCLCDASLVAWYPLEGNANDASVYSNQGIIQGAALSAADRFGRANAAQGFDMLDDRIVVPDSVSTTAASYQSGYTLAAWVYPTAFSGEDYNVIAGKGLGGFSIRLVDGVLQACHLATDGSTSCQTAGAACTLSIGEWAHVAVTWAAALTSPNWQMYMNGVACPYTGTVIGLAFALDGQVGGLAIGADDWYDRWYFAGSIDSVRLYNRALAAGEVATLSTLPD